MEISPGSCLTGTFFLAKLPDLAISVTQSWHDFLSFLALPWVLSWGGTRASGQYEQQTGPLVKASSVIFLRIVYQ